MEGSSAGTIEEARDRLLVLVADSLLHGAHRGIDFNEMAKLRDVVVAARPVRALVEPELDGKAMAGRCGCSVSDVCPLGRPTGSVRSCTGRELRAALMDANTLIHQAQFLFGPR